MIQLFQNVNIDWLANRRIFIGISILLMLAGLASAVIRQAVPGGTDAFNLGVDFKGGTVITARFLKERPSEETIRSRFAQQGVRDAIIQPTDKPDVVLIKVPRLENTANKTQAAPPPQTQAPPQSPTAQTQPSPGQVKR